MRRRRETTALYVTIVCNNPETLDGLQDYLRRAGVGAHGTRRIDDDDVIAPASTAVVVFPDDFAPNAVAAALIRLRARHPDVVHVVVTREPKRFAASGGSNGGPAPVIIAKPAWGWTILDAIRAKVGE